MGTDCFAKFLGDWALALWDRTKLTLFLAKDFMGTRQLFYRFQPHRGIEWSTVLDPLVKLHAHSFRLNEEFVAGYLSVFPPAHLTPYVGINAVAPSTFVAVTTRYASVHEYWRLDPSHRIRYGKDADYEENFRQLFALAIRRRLRASSPVLAELSGGIDSTSIVCVADEILREGRAETPRLDTISYYDDDEPNWDERPYFALVEAKRGRKGYHLNAGGTEGAFEAPQRSCFFPVPAGDALTERHMNEFLQCLRSSNTRVVLSGIGGDEVTGGVPTPLPELQDLLVSLRLSRFFQRLFQFGLVQRRAWLNLGFAVVEEFLPQAIRRIYANAWVAPWFTTSFVVRHREVFWTDAPRKRLSGPMPSFQESVSALDRLRRILGSLHVTPLAPCRTTYPYLDRDLLTFLFAIPREQLVRPGQRRSLLRRALAGIVPSEILARKRKAYVARHSVALIETAFPAIEKLLHSSYAVSAGWVRAEELRRSVVAARHGHLEHIVTLKKTMTLELWLQSMVRCRLLAAPRQSTHPRNHKAVYAVGTEIQPVLGLNIQRKGETP
jgi:asparagine synthase (glutamine-hydrolysing)